MNGQEFQANREKERDNEISPEKEMALRELLDKLGMEHFLEKDLEGVFTWSLEQMKERLLKIDLLWLLDFNQDELADSLIFDQASYQINNLDGPPTQNELNNLKEFLKNLQQIDKKPESEELSAELSCLLESLIPQESDGQPDQQSDIIDPSEEIDRLFKSEEIDYLLYPRQPQITISKDDTEGDADNQILEKITVGQESDTANNDTANNENQPPKQEKTTLNPNRWPGKKLLLVLSLSAIAILLFIQFVLMIKKNQERSTSEIATVQPEETIISPTPAPDAVDEIADEPPTKAKIEIDIEQFLRLSQESTEMRAAEKAKWEQLAMENERMNQELRELKELVSINTVQTEAAFDTLIQESSRLDEIADQVDNLTTLVQTPWEEPEWPTLAQSPPTSRHLQEPQWLIETREKIERTRARLIRY